MTQNWANSFQPDPPETQESCLVPKNPLYDESKTVVLLSKKQRRAFLKRERRRRKRQALATIKEAALNHVPKDETQAEDDNDIDEQEVDEESERLHQEWLERERIAQEEFSLKREKEAAAQRKREEEEKKIRDEWEEQQRKEKEELEQKALEKREKEEAVQKMLDQAESELENSGSWKNPDAPNDYGTEKDRANCPFFLKTGACRFGDRCSRKHNHPTSGTTLMVRSMFVSFGMEQSRRDDYDTDANLEYSEEEVHQQFVEFYDDVLPEFKSVGKVVQFKVSCNYEPHLRGNVYVQYETEEQCNTSFVMFNGRWYAGRQLQCEFCPVTRWKTAICGLYDRNKCPKGKNCNFLHVFRNPSNEFWEADRDLHLSPDRGGRDGTWSQRGNSSARSWRRLTDRRSPSRERYNYKRRRSCSRERRGHSREQQSRSRDKSEERGSNNRRDRNRSRRSRSRSRQGRKSHQSFTSSQRERSQRSRSRSHSKNIMRSKKSKSVSPVAKNGTMRKRGSQSPENSDKTNKENTSHHSRHSKKSKKKKSKKKHKKKKSKSGSVSCSAESDEDSGNGYIEIPITSNTLIEDCTVMVSEEQFPQDQVDQITNVETSLENPENIPNMLKDVESSSQVE